MERWMKLGGIVLAVVLQACAPIEQEEMLLIEGGTFLSEGNTPPLKEKVLSEFYLGRNEVTQAQWEEVMGYNPSAFKGPDFPVEMVSWYECIDYCNKRSIMEGFEPYYTISKETIDTVNFNQLDSVKWLVEVNPEANGYRLPTEMEWAYAATAGGSRKKYSGSNRIDEVAWYWRNSGEEYLEGDWKWEHIEKNKGRTKAVGLKQPNKWGLYDMSGNVREWCWDWYEDEELAAGYGRVWRGGGWLGGEHACEVTYRGLFEASGKGPDQGFRLARNAR